MDIFLKMEICAVKHIMGLKNTISDGCCTDHGAISKMVRLGISG